MDFGGGIIGQSGKDDFLLKLFNRTVSGGKRKYWHHHHSHFEITLFKEGSGTYIAGSSKSYDIRPGDVFVFSSHEVHCITDISGGGMTLMNLHFQPRFVWSGGADAFDLNFLKIFFERNKNFENRLPRDNPATAQIAKLLLEIESEFEKKEPAYELRIKINVLKILEMAVKSYNYVSASPADYELKSRQMKDIENALAYIDSNLQSDISLDALAKSANMSRSYFSTVFKNICGIPPWDYIAIKRVELATVQLKQKDKTMLEVALFCGFNNTANFNRTFKKVLAKTPSQYLKEHK